MGCFQTNHFGVTKIFFHKLLKTIHIELINIHGQIVKKYCLNEENIELNLNELNGGVYFVRIKSDGEFIIKRFVKK